MTYTSLTTLRTLPQFRAHLDALELDLPFDEAIEATQDSPLAAPLTLDIGTAGNRFCIQPMEGADAELDGRPTEHTRRRWMRFGESGAKLIWGCEAVAVRHDGRTNPRQLELTDESLKGLDILRNQLFQAHEGRFGGTDDLLVGLQLSHAGRWACAADGAGPAPRAAYRHPILDARAGVTDDSHVISDAEVEDLIEDFVGGAVDAQQMGFAFVDIMHCHGNLLHEFLSARTRVGAYGGAWENRTRLLREIVEGIRRDAPGLGIGVRASMFDLVPFQAGEDGAGEPVAHDGLLPYEYGFGVKPDNPTVWSLADSHQLLDVLEALDVELVNVSAGAPQYTVHLQRPAIHAAAGEYEPPEDPLVGVTRLLQVARDLKFHHSDAVIVGSGFSYLQEYLPNVAQAVVRDEWVDFVGLGRIALPYHDLPADVLQQGRLDRTRMCRTYSSCTAGPNSGKISGCYPLDPYYSAMPDTADLSERR